VSACWLASVLRSRASRLGDHAVVFVLAKIVGLVVKAIVVLVGLAIVYLAFTFAVVWHASTLDDRSRSDAIVVLGAAQYDGRPSPDLRARLDHAFELWQTGVAPVIVVTGGKQPGDRYTEAAAGARYLHARGVPDRAILREVQGRSSWESLQGAARFLEKSGRTRITLVSDAYHSARIVDIAEELGLHGVSSPSHFVHGSAQIPYLLRETVRVAGGRVFGYDVLQRHDRVGNLVPGLANIAALR
jgi:uncharacterized SAM-binding protein YcdF (DUF218 family)